MHYCPTGRDLLVKAVAALHLFPELANENQQGYLVQQASSLINGLSKGEDFAPILLALAELPPEKRAFCADASPYLIKETMTVEARLLILNALSAMRIPKALEEAKTLIHGLEKGEEIAAILRAIGEISGDDAEIAYVTRRAGREICDASSAEERVRALKENEADQWFSSLKILKDSKMPVEDQLRLKKAVKALPPQEQHAVTVIVSILTDPSMNGKDKLKVLNAVIALQEEREDISKSAQKLVHNSTNAEDVVRVLNAVAELPLREREDICNVAKELFNSKMNAEERVGILNAVAELPPREREKISNIAAKLAGHQMREMNGEEIVKALKAVAELPPLEREAISTMTLDLIKYSMKMEDRIKALKAVALLPSQTPRERLFYFNFAKGLLQNYMNAEERIGILNAVALLSTRELEAMVTRTSLLFTPSMDAKAIVALLKDPQARQAKIAAHYARLLFTRAMTHEDRALVLNAYLTLLPSQDLDGINRCAGCLITQRMNAKDIVSVLQALAALTPQELDAIGNYSSFIFPFSANAEAIVALLKNPQARHAKIAAHCASLLFTPEMTPEDRELVLNTYFALPPSQDLDGIDRCVRSLITQTTNPKNIVCVLQAVVALTPEKRTELETEEDFYQIPKYFLDRLEVLNQSHKENSPVAVVIVSGGGNIAQYNAANYHFFEQIAQTHRVHFQIAEDRKEIRMACEKAESRFGKKPNVLLLNGHSNGSNGIKIGSNKGMIAVTPDSEILPNLPLEKDAALLFRSCGSAKFAPSIISSLRRNSNSEHWTVQATPNHSSAFQSFFVDGQMLVFGNGRTPDPSTLGILGTSIFSGSGTTKATSRNSYETLMLEKEAYLKRVASFDETANEQLGLVHRHLAEYYKSQKNIPEAQRYHELEVTNPHLDNDLMVNFNLKDQEAMMGIARVGRIHYELGNYDQATDLAALFLQRSSFNPGAPDPAFLYRIAAIYARKRLALYSESIDQAVASCCRQIKAATEQFYQDKDLETLSAKKSQAVKDFLVSLKAEQ